MLSNHIGIHETNGIREFIRHFYTLRVFFTIETIHFYKV